MNNVIHSLTLIASLYVTEMRQTVQERQHNDSAAYYIENYGAFDQQAIKADSAVFSKIDRRSWISLEQRTIIRKSIVVKNK